MVEFFPLRIFSVKFCNSFDLLLLLALLFLCRAAASVSLPRLEQYMISCGFPLQDMHLVKDLRVCHTQHCDSCNFGTQLHSRHLVILLYWVRGREGTKI